MRAPAEKNIAQTRELCERSKNALEAVLASWEKSLVAAVQGAVALNRKIIDIAEHNINTGFDLATSLAGAKNLAEAMELQAAYLSKQFGDLRTQADEVRVLSTKVTANVAEPIKAQVTRDKFSDMCRARPSHGSGSCSKAALIGSVTAAVEVVVQPGANHREIFILLQHEGLVTCNTM